MANVKKGLETQPDSWCKHLRRFGKRFFWKKERAAEKKMIQEAVRK